jgi:hypothetical protein
LALIVAVGLNLAACSQKPLHGDTDFESAGKGFDRELTVDQRKAAIKKLQAETAGGAGGS